MNLFRLCLLVCVLSPSLAVAGHDSPYFPETGPAAVHQHMLELGTPAVVLWVALQPGYEDLAQIAHLRLAVGARVVVVYVTNGEATPDDEGGSVPVYIAAHRKEEADRVTRLLGATAHFLNVPDPGIVPRREILEQIWNTDTVVARVDRAVRHFRPDVLILGGDRRGGEIHSERQRLLSDLVLRAVKRAADPKARPDTVRPPAWGVSRVFLETAPAHVERQYDAVHPVWNSTYRSMATAAGALYPSLKYQLVRWHGEGDPRYSMIVPQGQTKAPAMLRGLPVAGPHSRAFRPTIDSLLRQRQGKKYRPRRDDVVRAIDRLDVVYARNRRELSPADGRIIAGWKNTLEALRCALLGVKVAYAVDDSLITQNQIVYLRFGEVLPGADSTRTQIFFPGTLNRAWVINESLLSQFPFSPDREFRMLSTHQLEFSVPMSQFGIAQSSLWSRFSFIIVHRDSVRGRDYIYRGEIPFRGAPRRTTEVLTPMVRAVDGAQVIVRLINVSRDSYKGTLRLTDSLVAPVEHEVWMPGRAFVCLDTVRLTLRSPLPPGDYPMKLNLSGGGELPFVARGFEVRTDTAAKVGVITAMKDSPLQQALSRLRIRWEKCTIVERSGLTPFNVVLLDRDVMEGPGIHEQEWSVLLDWVREGGMLLVMPPVSMNGSIPGAAFRAGSMLPPTASVLVDSMAGLMVEPNVLSPSDWDSWVVARSFGTVAVDRGRSAVTAVASDDGPLVVSLSEGRGTIRVVTLDLYSQLMNIHPGAHRILANLIALR